MNRRTFLALVSASLVLSIPEHSQAQQTGTDSGPFREMYGNVDGLDRVVLRTFSTSSMTMADITGGKVMIVWSSAFLFQEERDARKAMGGIDDVLTEMLASAFGSSGLGVTKKGEVSGPDLGDETISKSTVYNDDSGALPISLEMNSISVRKGNLIQVIYAGGLNTSAAQFASDVVENVDDRWPDNGHESASSSGRKSGGIWEALPKAQDVPPGFKISDDYDIRI